MTQSEAWLLQAGSDLAAAQAVYEATDTSTHCQAVAKYQQAVEKSVKGMIASVIEFGVPFNPITRDHDPSRQAEALLASRIKLNRKLFDRLKKILSVKRIAEIHELCSLAPMYPAPGALLRRNTEYPFNSGSATDWTAPAAAGEFTDAEVVEAHALAWLLKNQADGFRQILRLGKKQDSTGQS